MVFEGDIVERCIEGIVFEARITSVNKREKIVNIQYLDDGNFEDEVPFSEIHLRADSDSKSMSIDDRLQKVVSKKETLMKPLAGLVDDDFELRNQLKPTVILHDDDDLAEYDDSNDKINCTNKSASVDKSVVLNGAENKLAAGGGLRALRYLRK